jgi:hypothetical protein
MFITIHISLTQNGSLVKILMVTLYEGNDKSRRDGIDGSV